MSGERSVALAGLGHMGSRFAGRLAEAGWSTTVWDRERPVADEVAGATVADDLGALARAAGVVLLSVADDDAVREVALGGLLDAMPRDAVLIDLSTVAPATSRELAEAGAARGVHVLDAAVSGSTPQAEAGEVVMFVGGDEAVLERCRPILETLAKAVVHMGAHGAGTATKLSVNTLLGVGVQALAEAIALGEAGGLDRDRLLDALARTAVVPEALRGKLENARSDDYPVAFALRLMVKDFALVTRQAELEGVSMPVVEAAELVARETLAHSTEDEDFSVVIRRAERQALAERS
jgi:3-hydroxyisobutyrate dehydrogenase-like beta-hydroxyacid dehydrogenase